MTNYFKLSFNTNLGKTATINIKNPSPEADDALVKSTMDKIIALNIIDFTAGIPASRKSAAIVTKLEKEINFK